MPPSDHAAGDDPTNVPPPLTLRHPRRDVQVDFRWQNDRYDHVLLSGDKRLESLEQRAGDAWPDCPPLQQLSIESIAGHEVALGVGCAGTSHWSVSIEPTENGFRFDWACRTKKPPQRLGNCYGNASGFELHNGAETESQTNDQILTVTPRQSFQNAGTFRWQYELTSGAKIAPSGRQ